MEYCAICGHPISENNVSGIGSECLSIINYLTKVKISKDKNLFFALRNKEIKPFVDSFINVFKDTKFRSNFRKSFYNSICMTPERISNKQLEIIQDMLREKDNELYKRLFNLSYDIKIENFNHVRDTTKWDRSEIEKVRKYFRENKK